MNGAAVEPGDHDRATIAAMAISVYLISVVLHEALGHGLATVLVGGRIERLTSVELASAGTGAGWKRQAVAAAGPSANLVAGLAGLGLMPRARRPDTKYFLWLLGHVNLFIGAGYPLALSFLNRGDMHTILRCLKPLRAWQVGATGLGATVSLAAFGHALKTIHPFLGSGLERRRRAFTLTILPYLVGSTVNTLAALRNPRKGAAVAAAAATSFGGTALLAWTYRASRQEAAAELRTVDRRRRWLIAGVLAVVIYVLLLGPGIPHRPSSPA